jgi:hypothetical protein
MSCLSWLLFTTLIVGTMTTIIVVENFDHDDQDLNFLKEPKWKNIGIKTSSNGQHNSGGFHYKNN